jgi:EAL and modified HD-GYP domain-containing signal transduction protein
MTLAASAPAASSSSFFLGRQPILDARETLIGYELLFRDSTDNRAHIVDPVLATADVVCKAFAELGLAKAIDGYKAFVIVDEDFLGSEGIEMLAPDQVVFEVDARLAANPGVIDRCQSLGEAGYSFCLINPVGYDDAIAPFLKLAAFLKLNVRALPDDSLRALLNLPAEFRPIPIASHVETKADRERAEGLGFHFYQGYYFAEPTLVEGKKLEPGTQGLIRIINLLQHDAEVGEIERAFKSEAALTLNLLRLTNSVGMGLRVRISSVRHAVTMIGRRHILRWLQLLLYSRDGGMASFAHNPLMQLAALKGNFMERLARRCFPQQNALPDLAFLAGLMSLMPAALGLPMTEILEQLAIVPQLRQALLTREGDLGLLLELTDCYDNDDPAGADRVLLALDCRIDRDVLNQCLTESIAWVQTLGVEAD